MKLICSVVLVTGLLIQPTSSRADYAYAGAGALSCGKLAQEYREDPAQFEHLMMFWAQGFMSGLNIGPQNGTYRDLQAMTTEAQKASLRNYCDEHPMAEFIKAVFDLYGKLPLKKYTPPAATAQ
jgi:hypothetical protein